MARPPTTPEQRAETRVRLRRAAAEIHRDEGIGAVTVRSVTKLAGVSPGSLYNSFSGISELLRSLWLEPIMASGEQLAELAAEHTDPVERIRALLGAFADFVAANPAIHRGAMLYVRQANAPEPEVDDAESLPFFAHLKAAIVEGQRAGSIRPGDPNRLAQVTWSGLHGALALPVNAEIYALEPGEEVADDMIDLLVDALVTDD